MCCKSVNRKFCVCRIFIVTTLLLSDISLSFCGAMCLNFGLLLDATDLFMFSYMKLLMYISVLKNFQI